MARVVVGLSGGVDSSIAAYLLQEQGHEVIGLFMKNWHDDGVTLSDECPWLEDSQDAMMVAQSLNIPFQTIDLSESYKNQIVDYMFAEYERGRTPNPDVLCNREIKFDIFLKIALSLGADFVATGHYCDKAVISKPQGDIYRLLAGRDTAKDQSYFLCQLSQAQLQKALFPLGKIKKDEVRHIAQSIGLLTAQKKDSQGLCFVGKVHLPDFLKQRLAPKEGRIIEISSDNPIYKKPQSNFETDEQHWHYQSQNYHYTPQDGVQVGTHKGAYYFTIGQRKGLDVGGTTDPLFVIATDISENIIYVGQGRTHPGLYKKTIFIADIDTHWVNPNYRLEQGKSFLVNCRIRYRQPLQKAHLHKVVQGIYIDFDSPQSAVTEGQFAAWYIDRELIGSGII